jgi:hypothetical protein
VIRLDPAVQRIINAADFARTRAYRELEQGDDLPAFAFDIRSAGEALLMAADILDGTRDVTRGGDAT